MTVALDVGRLRQVGTLSAPGDPAADGDGGYTQTYAALSPSTWRFAIEPATSRTAERHFAATVIAHATAVLRGRYHSGITTKTRIVWTDRSGATHTADVLAVDDTEGAGVESVVLVSEVTTE